MSTGNPLPTLPKTPGTVPRAPRLPTPGNMPLPDPLRAPNPSTAPPPAKPNSPAKPRANPHRFRPRKKTGLTPINRPGTTTTPRPPAKPALPTGTVKPGTGARPGAGALNALLAELLISLSRSLQEQIATKVITETPLADGTTETKRESRCLSATKPPCFGYGSVPTRFVDGAWQGMEKRIKDNQLHFALSALASRTYMRLHKKTVDHATELLEGIIRRGVRCPKASDSEKVCRKRVQREVEVCVRKERLPNGSKN